MQLASEYLELGNMIKNIKCTEQTTAFLLYLTKSIISLIRELLVLKQCIRKKENNLN